MLKLYYAPNTISVATAITLYEANLPFDPIKVNFDTAEQAKPKYLAVNPKGRVPALATDQGTLTETGALLDYIAAQAPATGLVPADPFQAARMREVMYYLASTMHVNHAHKRRGYRWANNAASHQDMTAKAMETMTASCAYIESKGLVGPYVLGDRFSLADPYLFTICTWLEGDGVDCSAFPKFTRFMAMMETRASVQAVRAAGIL